MDIEHVYHVEKDRPEYATLSRVALPLLPYSPDRNASVVEGARFNSFVLAQRAGRIYSSGSAQVINQCFWVEINRHIPTDTLAGWGVSGSNATSSVTIIGHADNVEVSAQQFKQTVGVNICAEGDVMVCGDVVGHDKTTTNIETDTPRAPDAG